MPIVLNFKTKIVKPMYDAGRTKYVTIEINPRISQQIQEMYQREARSYKLVVPPAPDEHILDVKVPWRYNRVMCQIQGLVPVQNMTQGQEVHVHIEYCGTWALGCFWKLSAISTL